MTEAIGLDLFGGHAIEDIPETNDLPVGKYPECVIDSAKAIKSSNGNYGLAINFKDVSDEGFGLSAFQWIGIPAPADRAQYLLRDLKALSLTGEQIVAIAGNVVGSDPETAEVNINGISEVLSEIVGTAGTVEVTAYTNKRTGAPGTNVSFKVNEEATGDFDEPRNKVTENQRAAAPETQADTTDWFGN